MEIIRKTIGRMLNETAEKYPNQEALIHTDVAVRYNYSLLLWEVDRSAKGLMNAGVEKGDRVVLWAPNIPEWVVAMLALNKIGAIFVPLDPGAGHEELLYVLVQSESKAIILARGLEDEEYVDMFFSIRDKVPFVEHAFVIATQSYPETVPWTEMTASGEDVAQEILRKREKEIRPTDPAAIMYTSGTTGVPKGVVLDHLGLINKSLASTRRQGLTHEDSLCLFFPLFHMFGNTCIALSGLLTGATLVMPCLAFDPPKVLDAIYKQKCTAIYGSPSMMIGLLDHPVFKKKRFASVKKGTLGGAPCPMELMKTLVERVGVSRITVAYGITEASSWITMTYPDDPLELRVTTIGVPLECNEVKIIHGATGEDLKVNQPGELCVRGLLMKEYYKMPGLTSSVIDKEGWFHTGDIGEINEKGYVKITGRIKDVIVRNGIEIYPAELEEILYTLPEISEVQVFGFPHPRKGQEVAAWIKPRRGAKLSVEEVARFARRKIEKQKVPHYFKLVRAFPTTRSGKIQKYKLAENATREYAAELYDSTLRKTTVGKKNET
ncbi:MAG: AMP-binding protein [Deltaproteobacteria bacterium]|nr:AMP-binding protein [Deltaproteobacteria bacterium]